MHFLGRGRAAGRTENLLRSDRVRGCRESKWDEIGMGGDEVWMGPGCGRDGVELGQGDARLDAVCGLGVARRDTVQQRRLAELWQLLVETEDSHRTCLHPINDHPSRILLGDSHWVKD